MATDDDVIAKIFGKIDVDNSGSVCEAEMSAAFLGFDRDGEFCICVVVSVVVQSGPKVYTPSNLRLLIHNGNIYGSLVTVLKSE